MKENRLTLVFLGKHKKAPSYRGCFNKNNKYLNPLTPCGVRPRARKDMNLAEQFQSTHPVWGETGMTRKQILNLIISIHSPRAGRDSRTAYEHDPHRSSYLMLSHFPARHFFCNSKFPKLHLFTEPGVVPSDIFQCLGKRLMSSSLVMIRAPVRMPVQDLTRRSVVRRDDDPLVSCYVAPNSDIVTVRYQHCIFIQVSQRQQLFPAEHRHLPQRRYITSGARMKYPRPPKIRNPAFL